MQLNTYCTINEIFLFLVFFSISNYYKIYRLIFHDWRFKCPLFAIIKKECIGLKYNALA